MSRDAIKAPYDASYQHEASSHPGQDQKLAPLVCVDANVVAVMVDDVRRLHHDSRGDSTCEPNGDERKPVDQDIDESTQAAFKKDPQDSTDESDADEANTNAVEDEGRSLRNAECTETSTDFTRPLKRGEVDIAVTALIQLFLKRCLRVESIQRRFVAARRHVLLNAAPAQGSVWNGTGSVEALAIVKNMCGVEVV